MKEGKEQEQETEVQEDPAVLSNGHVFNLFSISQCTILYECNRIDNEKAVVHKIHLSQAPHAVQSAQVLRALFLSPASPRTEARGAVDAITWQGLLRVAINVKHKPVDANDISVATHHKGLGDVLRIKGNRCPRFHQRITVFAMILLNAEYVFPGSDKPEGDCLRVA